MPLAPANPSQQAADWRGRISTFTEAMAVVAVGNRALCNFQDAATLPWFASRFCATSHSNRGSPNHGTYLAGN
jgi:hypothetical protein